MLIGPFSNPSEAHSLHSYAMKRQLRCQLVQQGGRYWLQAEQPADTERLQALWHAYRQAPETVRAEAWQDEVLAEPVEVWSAERRAQRTWAVTLKRLSLWQWTVIGAALLVFALMNLGFERAVLTELLFSQWPHGAPELRQGELWRLLSPILLHFSLMHLAFNLLWFWQLSGQIRRYFPLWLNPLLLVLSAVLSNSLQYLWSASMFGGLSGVVYALLGFVWWQGRSAKAPVRVSTSIVYFMLGWLVIGFTGVLDAMMPMANMAHLGGLVVGMAVAQAWRWFQYGEMQ